jgi:organic radical activating enzyme
MYLQITSRCNMSCKHCGMSCTKKGEDMSIETFRNALNFNDDSITIGGGEPTLHPLFWQMLMESVAKSENVWMATNGSQTEIAITLASLAKKGVLGVALSLDEFHDPIDPKVVEAFQNIKRDYSGSEDCREIRNVSDNLIKSGRCKDGKKGCICEDVFFKPNGEVRMCGCRNSPVIGNINNSFEYPDNYM